MRHDGRLVCLLILAACGTSAAPRGPDLQITGESTKLRRGEALPATSPLFDGETVRLRGLRWEKLAIIVWRRDETPVDIALELPRARVDGFTLTDQPVTRASTRMYGPSRGPGDYPDKLVPLAKATRATLFEIDLDTSTEGKLTVGAQTFDVIVTVDAENLDADAPPIWAYVHPKELARVGVTEEAVAEVFWEYGVTATRDFGLDAWDSHRALLDGFPYIPVLLPDDAAGYAREIPAWKAIGFESGKTPFAIPIDEPGDDATRADVKRRAEIARDADGPGRFLFAVTDRPRAIYGNAVDVFITSDQLMRERDPKPERWTYNGTPPFAGSMILDTDGVAMRTWGWIAWRWRIPLWYIWDGTYWTDRHKSKRVTDFAKDAVTFDDGDDHGNLDGVLVYPDLAPSLRLVALRRGLEDAQLLAMVEACAGRPTADAIARKIVPVALGDAGEPGQSRAGSWPTDEAVWEAARIELLDRLAQCRR